MKRPWVFNDHLPLIPDAGLKIVFFCTLSRHKHHFVHNFQDLTTVLLYIISKILPSPQSFCTNISKFCHKHMYTVQCALCMSYLAQDGTMKKKEHQNIYFNQTQGSIFHFNMMSLVPTSIWNFITWNIYWEKMPSGQWERKYIFMVLNKHWVDNWNLLFCLVGDLENLSSNGKVNKIW